VRSLESFLDYHRLLAPPPRTASEELVAAYRMHLEKVRGVAGSTLKNHCNTASSLLTFLEFDGDRATLRDIDPRCIEEFLVDTATRRARAALQQSLAHLRSFVRFLVSRGDVVPGLDASIDTPRLYRGEQLPRALAWDVVQAFLGTIDRPTPRGRRDYAMFLLIATYGLRVSEVAALRLDDIAWRTERIRVPRPKVSAPLVLPLTVEAGAALVDYVRHVRPKVTSREVFLSLRAPIGPLVPTTVGEAFRRCKHRSGLPIGDHSAHCLRHSLAVHLLRQGTSIKAIGDLLGHRSIESTCVYLRLHVADLREAALDLPREDQR
jgi:site-specific recombinase XerD